MYETNKFVMQPTIHAPTQLSNVLTMFYKIKIYFQIHIIGANVMLVASQISLLANHLVYYLPLKVRHPEGVKIS
jgi:hypothetical protein